MFRTLRSLAQAGARRSAGSTRRAVQVAGLLALGLVIGLAAPALAEDTRPKEIPYDTPGEVPQLDPGYRSADHKVVLITDDSLNPRLVTLNEGQLVAWISYARSPSTIIFEREVARSMICHSLVNFQLKDDELRSAEIHTGEFASFCQLKPGRYLYKVVRTDPNAGGAVGSARQLRGEIIVGNPSP